MSKKSKPDAELFGKMVAFGGGGAVIASVVLGSVIPIAAAAVGLFTTLCYMNGLNERDHKRGSIT